MAAAGITPSAVVVDVGTGTGFMAEGALAAGAHVIGVDSSDRMLARLERQQINNRLPAQLPPDGSQNSVYGATVAVNGAREQSNNFLLDGTDNNDSAINPGKAT